VYNICNVLFVIFTVLSAVASNMGMLTPGFSLASLELL
jgi:hypothetical protein